MPGLAAKAVATVRDGEFRAQVREDLNLAKDIAQGKARERFAPLMDRLAHRAFFSKDPVQTAPSAAAGYAQPVAMA